MAWEAAFVSTVLWFFGSQLGHRVQIRGWGGSFGIHFRLCMGFGRLSSTELNWSSTELNQSSSGVQQTSTRAQVDNRAQPEFSRAQHKVQQSSTIAHLEFNMLPLDLQHDLTFELFLFSFHNNNLFPSPTLNTYPATLGQQPCSITFTTQATIIPSHNCMH